MMTNRFLLGLSAFWIGAALSPLLARTWTEAGTSRTLDGEFVRATPDAVLIRKPNGSTVTLPLTRLSEADQAFIKEQASTNAKSSADSKDRAPQGDVKKDLIGNWQGVMVDPQGSPHGEIRLVITETEITASRGSQPMGRGTYSISAGSAGLHQIDATGTAGQFNGKSYAGIFSIAGNTLKWCSANDNPNSKRPQELKTDPPSGHFMMVVEKEH